VRGDAILYIAPLPLRLGMVDYQALLKYTATSPVAVLRTV
jgi:hypothetical protein